MDSVQWDQRYAASDLVWSATPNMWVEEVASALAPGRALDLAAGEGRNALWLVEQGWEATAVDFSPVATERSLAWAKERLGAAAPRFTAYTADLLQLRPTDQGFDLVMVVYLQIPAEDRWLVLRAAVQSVAPGGRLLVVAHHSDNLDDGVGGPQDPGVLYSQADVVDDLDGTGFVIERAERVLRPVQTADGPLRAIDTVVVARRPL